MSRMPTPKPAADRVVIPFPFHRVAGPRLNAGDVAELRAWESKACKRGYALVTLNGNDAATIYWRGDLWTLLVGSLGGPRIGLRRRGTTLTTNFSTIGEALAAMSASPDADEPLYDETIVAQGWPG